MQFKSISKRCGYYVVDAKHTNEETEAEEEEGSCTKEDKEEVQ